MDLRTENPIIHRFTGFQVGTVRIPFGVLRSLSTTGILDWQRDPVITRLEGISGVVTQVLTHAAVPVIRPRQISYRLWLESVADAQALDGFLGQVGTLTTLAWTHTAPVAEGERAWMGDRFYDVLPDVLLVSLINREVFAISESVEVDATFQMDGS
jgi:hypothetical protein